MLDRTVEGHLVDPLPPLEQTPQRTWIHDRAGEEVRPRLLPLLEHGNGDFAQPLADLRRLLEQPAESDRAGEPCRTGADDQHADLDALVVGIARRGDEVLRTERRRKICGLRHEPLRCLTSSVSLGTTSWTSPTTPRSENSKIGAFASLLIATITPELCMPTLCWIAPEIPQAM